MKIVFLDCNTVNPGDLSWSVFDKYEDFNYYEQTDTCQVIDRANKADIIITNKVKLNRKHFSLLPKLKLICVASAGYDIINIEDAKAFNITVCNAAGYGTETVAQMVLAHLLNFTNRVEYYNQLNKKGEWSKSLDFCYWKSPIIELKGKVATIIGLGQIGLAVAKLFNAFGIKVAAVTHNMNLPSYIKSVTLEEAFKKSDIISLNCALTSNNKEFINRKLLNLAKPSLILINTARGCLINEPDLIDFLRQNSQASYCTDVLSKEPPLKDNTLLSLSNVYSTPHIAWASVESRKRILDIVKHNIDEFLLGHPTNVVSI